MPNEHMMDEDDIGSGERSPGAKETEKEISKIGTDRPERDKLKKNEKEKGPVDEARASPSKGN